MRTCLLISMFLWVALASSAQPACQTSQYRDLLMARTPGLAGTINSVEAFTRNQQQVSQTEVNGQITTPGSLSLITIPVVVHVLYFVASENISNEQIYSQINVLNQDLSRTNPDTINTPAVFRQFAADCGFKFVLAKVDPHGYATTGIIRKFTPVQAFDINDEIKHSQSGGDDAWDCDNYLNIWVGNLIEGMLGYSSVVGGPKDVDGITVLYTAFGTTGMVAAPFDRGRTATHELGHWLNLIHTWGDADCGDDHVEDTPWQEAPNRGCPTEVKKTCGPGPYGDMYMNFMDFTNDACMNLFTKGQNARMRSLFAPGGLRYPLLSTTELSAIPLADTIAATPTGEFGHSPLFLYPNPSSSVLAVEVSSLPAAGLNLDIYNSLGQKVQTVKLHQNVQEINISSLPVGIYFIKIADGTSSSVKKLVKI
jgi:hypothetical protein